MITGCFSSRKPHFSFKSQYLLSVSVDHPNITLNIFKVRKCIRHQSDILCSQK